MGNKNKNKNKKAAGKSKSTSSRNATTSSPSPDSERSIHVPDQNLLCNTALSLYNSLVEQIEAGVGSYEKMIGFLNASKGSFFGNEALLEELYCQVYLKLNAMKNAIEHASAAYTLYKRNPKLVQYSSTFLVLGHEFQSLGDQQLVEAYDMFEHACRLEPHNELLKKNIDNVVKLQEEYRMRESLAVQLMQEEAEELERIEKEKQKKVKPKPTKKPSDEESPDNEAPKEESVLFDEDSPNEESAVVDENSPNEESAVVDEKPWEMSNTSHISIDKKTFRGIFKPKYGPEFRVSFLSMDDDAVPFFHDLSQLCSSSDLLLTVHALEKNPITEFYQLVTEEVMTFDEYRDQLLMKFRNSDKSELSDWWPFIKDAFYSLLRDVIEGLLFLYLRKSRACGKLSSNLYVTLDGKARILPSVGNSDFSGKGIKANDVFAVTCFVKQLLCPFAGANIADEIFSFPKDILSFLDFASRHKSLPAEYLLKHPFSWKLTEKVYFPTFVKKALYRTPPNVTRIRMLVLNTYLSVKGLFPKWANTLDENTLAEKTLFKAIWSKGDPLNALTPEQQSVMKSAKLVQVSPYRNEVGLIRYVDAVLGHATDGSYSHLRPEGLTYQDIVEHLFALFPDFFRTVYESIGSCVANRVMDEGILAELYNKDKLYDGDRW